MKPRLQPLKKRHSLTAGGSESLDALKGFPDRREDPKS